MFDDVETTFENLANIKVIGVGGGGNKGHENDPFKLLIDDVLSVVPGEATSDGESVRASINFLGSLAITNPSVCGVGVFNKRFWNIYCVCHQQCAICRKFF